MITIELGQIRTGFSQSEYTPFWFTNDKTIYMSSQVNPLVELDETTLTHAAKTEIITAITFGDLIASEEDYQKLLSDVFPPVTGQPVVAPPLERKEPIIESKPEIDRTKVVVDIPADPKDTLTKKAERYLRLKAIAFNQAIGSGTNIEPGITDLELLDHMLEIESTKFKPRKPYVKTIENRIKIVQEEGFVVTETKYATIKIENDTISTIEVLQ